MTKRVLTFARDVRRAPTPAEERLWRALRCGALAGLKWRRQVPFGNILVDLHCPTARVAVEVDGATHGEPARDIARDAALRAVGINVVHVSNNDVMGNLEGVLQ